MANTGKPFMKLDIDFCFDADIRRMVSKVGKGAVYDYFVLCNQMYRYESTNYAIPEDDIPLLTGATQSTETELREMIAYCLGNGFFEEIEDATGEKYIISARRRSDLFKQKEASLKMSEAGKRGNAKRWKNNKEGDTRDED